MRKNTAPGRRIAGITVLGVMSVVGGIVALGRITGHPVPRPRPVAVSTPPSRTRAHVPHGGRNAKRALNEVASFAAASGQPATTGLQTVRLPWQATTQWAVDPVAVPRAHQPARLWFGQRHGAGPWHWTAIQLPDAIPAGLPPAVADALQRAWDLSQGEPGPTLPGAIQWATLTGRVGLPTGWTLQTTPATNSPLAAPSVTLTVWMPSHTGLYHGSYGLETVWDAHNARTGTEGLAGLVAGRGPG